MGKHYKISTIVWLTLLSFHVSKLQARSLEDNESVPNISEPVGNIEEWTKQCACFPKSDIGIPVSQYLPPDIDHERLVVYLYKNRNTNQFTAYIPSWKKQESFPDLSFDFEDKLEQTPHEGISYLFDTAHFPISSEGVYITPSPVLTLGPKEDVISTIKVPGVSNYGIFTTPIADNQGKINKVPFVKGPSGAIPVSVAQTSDQIVQVTKPNQELNSPHGNIQLPIQGAIVGPPQVPNESPENQNQQTQVTPVLPDGMHTQYFPGRPIVNDKKLPVIFPDISSQSPQKVNFQLGHKNQPIPGSLDKNLNMPSVTSSGLGYLMKYGLPAYDGLSSPSKSHNVITPGKIDSLSPDMSNELVNVEYPQVNYDHPIFNDWFNKQVVNIKPKTGNSLNFHSLKFFLIRILYENGIRLSEDGNLHDANGNVLKLSNLKIRPIFLGDPRDYEKLMATNKCVIPYDIQYLEAILLTLEYPPRILAVIPLSLGNLLSFTDNVQPRLDCVGNCGHCSTCPSKFRSGVSEEEESSSNLSVQTSTDESNDSLQKSEAVSEVPEENDETNNYVYAALNNDLSVNVNSEPKKRCGQSGCQVQTDFQSSLPQIADLSALRRALNVGINNEEHNISSATNEETSDGNDGENELTYSNDISPESKSGIGDGFLNVLSPIGQGIFNNLIPVANRRKCDQETCQEHPIPPSIVKENESKNEELQNNKEFLVEESSDSKANQNILVLQLKPNDQGVLNGDVIFLDQENGKIEKKPLDDFEVTQENDKKSEDEDYEMLTIRIVGGNPATSSGTPVISKGRSGFIDH